MPLQMRMSERDPRFFSPDRDLAYCTPYLVTRAIQGLEPERQEPWVEKYLGENKLSQDQLAEGAVCLAEYMNKTIFDPQYKQPFDSLTAAGFFKLPEQVQTILLAKLGQVFLSGFFSSARDVTRESDKPPIDVKQIGEEANILVEKVRRYKATPRWRKTLSRFFSRIRDLF